MSNTQPPGLRLGTRCHVVPFHCSASGHWLPWLVSYQPTALARDGDATAIPLSSTRASNPGLGLGVRCRVLPFQRYNLARAAALDGHPEPPQDPHPGISEIAGVVGLVVAALE
jgi:hypothetical protein